MVLITTNQIMENFFWSLDVAKHYVMKYYIFFFIIGCLFVWVSLTKVSISIIIIWWILYILGIFWLPFLFALYKGINRYINDWSRGRRLYWWFVLLLLAAYVPMGVFFPPLAWWSAWILWFFIAWIILPFYIVISLILFAITIKIISNTQEDYIQRHKNHFFTKKKLIIWLGIFILWILYYTFYNTFIYHVALNNNDIKKCPWNYSLLVKPIGVAPKGKGYIKNMCYENIAFKTKDESLCELINQKHICYRDIRILKDDINVCDKLEGHSYMFCINDTHEGVHFNGKGIYKIVNMCKNDKQCLYNYYMTHRKN